MQKQTINSSEEILLTFDTEEDNKEFLSLKEILTDIQSVTVPRIISMLDKYVIGQKDAKENLALAVVLHLKKIYNHLYPELSKTNKDIQLNKYNVLIYGNTGTGKTHLLKTLSKILHLPLAIVDATSLTQGNLRTNVLTRLIEATKSSDIGLAEFGIVYIDEIDKIRQHSTHINMHEGVQQSLLKIVEGTTCEVPISFAQPDRKVSICTDNILFICGGAFSGIEPIVGIKRKDTKTLGFGADNSNFGKLEKFDYSKITVDNLIEFGLIPEFLGRFPVKTHLDLLCEESMINILTKSKDNLIEQYTDKFAQNDNTLEITGDALKIIANKALSAQSGARGLVSLMFNLLKIKLMESSVTTGQHFIVDKDYAEKMLN